jgi:hypothetical protein
MERLGTYSESGEGFPNEELRQLKRARLECMAAFDDAYVGA